MNAGMFNHFAVYYLQKLPTIITVCLIETESQSKVEIDLSEIESTNLNLMAEVRQFHQLRVSLLLSLRRFDELYEILSTRLQFCLLQDMSQPSHTQVIFQFKLSCLS